MTSPAEDQGNLEQRTRDTVLRAILAEAEKEHRTTRILELAQAYSILMSTPSPDGGEPSGGLTFA